MGKLRKIRTEEVGELGRICVGEGRDNIKSEGS